MGGVIVVAETAIKIASGVVIGVGLEGVVGVVGAAVRVTSNTVIGVSGGAAIGVISSRGIISLSKVKLNQSCKAIVIIGLILIRAKPISLSIYL